MLKPPAPGLQLVSDTVIGINPNGQTNLHPPLARFLLFPLKQLRLTTVRTRRQDEIDFRFDLHSDDGMV